MIHSISTIQGRLTSQKGKIFSQGEKILLSVVEKEAPGIWKVMVKNRVFQVNSKKHLKVGQNYPAEVSYKKGSLEFHIAADPGRAGIQGSEEIFTRRLLSQMAESGIYLKQKSIHLLKKKLEGLKQIDNKSIKLLSVLMDKNIIFTEEQIDTLYDFLYNKRESQDRGQKRNQSHPSLKEQLKHEIGKTDKGKGQLLHLFNHLKGKNSHWVILPFATEWNGQKMEGILKICFSLPKMKAEKFVLHIPESWGGYTWLLRPGRGKKEIAVIEPADGHPFAEQDMKRLRLKLEKFNIEFDQMIKSSEEFDGFDYFSSQLLLNEVDQEV